jgi:hypothetical protein
MKVTEVTRYGHGYFQVTAESRRGRRYQCLADREGQIVNTFRQEPSQMPGYDLWLYAAVPPALRAAALTVRS